MKSDEKERSHTGILCLKLPQLSLLCLALLNWKALKAIILVNQLPRSLSRCGEDVSHSNSQYSPVENQAEHSVKYPNIRKGCLFCFVLFLPHHAAHGTFPTRDWTRTPWNGSAVLTLDHQGSLRTTFLCSCLFFWKTGYSFFFRQFKCIVISYFSFFFAFQ